MNGSASSKEASFDVSTGSDATNEKNNKNPLSNRIQKEANQKKQQQRPRREDEGLMRSPQETMRMKKENKKKQQQQRRARYQDEGLDEFPSDNGPSAFRTDSSKELQEKQKIEQHQQQSKKIPPNTKYQTRKPSVDDDAIVPPNIKDMEEKLSAKKSTHQEDKENNNNDTNSQDKKGDEKSAIGAFRVGLETSACLSSSCLDNEDEGVTEQQQRTGADVEVGTHYQQQQDLPLIVASVVVEEQNQQQTITTEPKPDPTDLPPLVHAEPSSSNRNKRTRFALLTILLLLLIATGIAVAVIFATRRNGEVSTVVGTNENRTNNVGGGNEQPPTTISNGIIVIQAISPPPNLEAAQQGFVLQVRLHEFILLDRQENGFVQVASSNATSEQDCVNFCNPFDALLYHQEGRNPKYNTEAVLGPGCTCFQFTNTSSDGASTCLARWGDGVNQDGVDLENEPYVPFGSVLVKLPEIAQCPLDFCQTIPNHWYCFTSREFFTHEVILDTVGGFALDDTANITTPSLRTCLRNCASHDAVQYAQSAPALNLLGLCTCYNIVNSTEPDLPCLAPLGPRVGPADNVPFGSILVKTSNTSTGQRIRDRCPFDFCSANNAQHWYCFTANDRDLITVSITSQGGFTEPLKNTTTITEHECLMSCQLFDAMVVNEIAPELIVCTCHNYNVTTVGSENSTLPCLVPWGDRVDQRLINLGTVFTKDPVDTCSFDFCQANPMHWFCFTGNGGFSHQEVSLTGSVGLGFTPPLVQATTASTRECLQLCAPFDAAQHVQMATEGNCTCHDFLSSSNSGSEETFCLVPWGVNVFFGVIPPGSVFVKEPIAPCSSIDFCDLNPNHWYCLSGNEIPLDVGSFTEAGGFTRVVDSIEISADQECWQLCAPFDAAQVVLQQANNFATSSLLCSCFQITNNNNETTAVARTTTSLMSNEPCFVPWANLPSPDAVLPIGVAYTKRRIDTCTFDFCTAHPRHPFCVVTVEFSLHSVSLSESGGFTGSLALSTTQNLEECIEFCAPYEALQYAEFYPNFADGGNCTCHDIDENATAATEPLPCALPWGPNIFPAVNIIPFGTAIVKRPIGICTTMDFCQTNPNEAICFSANGYQASEGALTIRGGFTPVLASTIVPKERDCWDFCASNDVVQVGEVSFDSTDRECLCYDYNITAEFPAAGTSPIDASACVARYDDRVNLGVAGVFLFAEYFAKQPLVECLIDFCDLHPDHWFCFTGTRVSLNQVSIAPGLVVPALEPFRGVPLSSSFERECLQRCAPYDVVQFTENDDLGDECACFTINSTATNETCFLVPWGPNVDPSFLLRGTIYLKQTKSECSADFCTLNPNHWYCFTGNQIDLSRKNINGTMAQATFITGLLVDCLQLCASYTAVTYFEPNDDAANCKCYEAIDCLVTTTEEEEKNGHVLFTKNTTAVPSCV